MHNSTRITAAWQTIHPVIAATTPRCEFLMTGTLGKALYYFTLYEMTGEPAYGDEAVELVYAVAEGTDGSPVALAGTGLAAGQAGLGFMLTLLQLAGLATIDLAAELEETDAGIFRQAMYQLEEEERPDYLQGALGALPYFFLRSNEPAIRAYIDQLLTAFCATAVHEPEGSWFKNFIVDTAEKARIDLGISHGNAGFLLLLLEAKAIGAGPAELDNIIEEGIRFMLAHPVQSYPESPHSDYPFFIAAENKGVIYAPPRLAWCYGDLNVAWVLAKAGKLFNRTDWSATGASIAKATLSRRLPEDTLVTDSHFCHGAAGLAHFYRILDAEWPGQGFDTAACYWLDTTLDYLDEELEGDYYKGREDDLLNGLPGVVLSILGFNYPQALNWNRLFLL